VTVRIVSLGVGNVDILDVVLSLQVTYSQCLGVIGYSLLPMTIIAAFLPVVHSQHAISLCFKVFTIHRIFLLFFVDIRKKANFP